MQFYHILLKSREGGFGECIYLHTFFCDCDSNLVNWQLNCVYSELNRYSNDTNTLLHSGISKLSFIRPQIIIIVHVNLDIIWGGGIGNDTCTMTYSIHVQCATQSRDGIKVYESHNFATLAKAACISSMSLCSFQGTCMYAIWSRVKCLATSSISQEC